MGVTINQHHQFPSKLSLIVNRNAFMAADLIIHSAVFRKQFF
jgi:hypothetical protein